MRGLAGALFLAVGTWGVVASSAPASLAPAAITQQGRILGKDGMPVSTTIPITFTIYNDAKKSADANILWTETQNITLDDGYFSARLGDGATALDPTIFGGSELFLGVTVGSDSEMAPREVITSVPYAFSAQLAAEAQVADSMPFAKLTGIPAPCADGSYLAGYNAAGVAQCKSLPAAEALSCTTRFAATAGTTSSFIGCNAGEMLTGGGCASNGALQSSYDYTCTNPPCLIFICQNPPCLGFGDWYCSAPAASSTRAFAECCKVQ
jgi:hypothetical protein